MTIKSSVEYIGIITNYLSEQLLERDYHIIRISFKNFKSEIEKYSISKVYIDNDIYEVDHPWFKKKQDSIISYLDEKEVEIIYIKNSKKEIESSMKKYFIWNIELNDAFKHSNNSISTPIFVNEKLYNPIEIEKTIDLLNVDFNNENNSNEWLLSCNFSTVYLNEISRENVLNLISLIKKSKVVFVNYYKKVDNIFLTYLEIIAVLSNTIFIVDEKYNKKPKYKSDFNNEPNKMFIRGLIKSNLFWERTCISLSRQAFLTNTLINKTSVPEVLSKKIVENDIEISIITSSKRKGKLRNYIKQLNRQRYVKLEVILITHGFTLKTVEKDKFLDLADFKLKIIDGKSSMSLGNCLNECLMYVSKDYVTKIDDDDFYYANYLIDMWIAKQYSQADVVGKGAHFVFLKSNEALLLRKGDQQYKFVSHVIGSSLFCSSDLLKEYSFSDLDSGEDTNLYERIKNDGKTIYATHPYENSVYRSKNKSSHTWKINEIKLLSTSEIVSYGKPNKYLEIL